MPDPITRWIDARIAAAVKVAVDEAMQNAKNDVIAEMQAIERTLTAQITLLPGLLGSQIQNVAVDAGAVAVRVVTAITDHLASLPQQVIAGVLQGIPNVLNPFR